MSYDPRSEWAPIDACCDRFEAAWIHGTQPDLEAFVGGFSEPDRRARVFECLLQLDCDYRRKRGDAPSAADYVGRFPEFVGIIQRELTANAETQFPRPPGEPPRQRALPVTDRYEVQGEIARGGMGAVLRGHDHNLNRELAIKVLLEEYRGNPHVVARFMEEARIGGQLQHPGIVPVYELGRFSDDRPFFSMKLVKGDTLTKLLAARATPAADRARLLGIFKQVCETLAYAHSRRVIHRDLKPGNIMVGAFGEVQVMDWGLAKVRFDQSSEPEASDSITRIVKTPSSPDQTANPSQTIAGSVMGTPAYMPPEQAQGLIGLIDERADVFGLGAILCEILTGKPPYVASSRETLLQLSMRGELRECFTRLGACDADQELIDLAQCCLAPLDDRPRHAGVVAERMTNYLTGVEARLQEARVKQAQEAARAEEALRTAAEAESKTRAERHARKLQVGFAVSLLVLITIAGIAATFAAVQQSKLKLKAQNSESKAVAAQKSEAGERRRADLTLSDMQASRGLLAAQRDSAGESVLWFATAAEQASASSDPKRAADNLVRARNWLAQAMIPVGVVQLDDAPERLEFQPQGDHLLIQTAQAIHVHDWRNARQLEWSTNLGWVHAAAFSPDGKTLALGLPGEMQAKRQGNKSVGLQLRQMPDGQVIYEHPEGGQVIALAFSADGKRLATAGRGIRWLDLEPRTWTLVARPQKAVRDLKFNAAGDRFSALSVDSQVRVFSIEDDSAKLLFTVAHQPGVRSSPVFIGDAHELVTIVEDKLARFDLTMGTPAARGNLPLSAGSLSRVVASPDGQWLASGGYYGPEIRSAIADNAPATLLQHTNYVADLAFSPDSHCLLTASSDGTSQIWSLAERRQLATLLHTSSVACCAWSPDGEHFATAQGDGLVRIWRLPKSHVETKRVADWGHRARLSHDGKLLSPGLMHESATGGSRTESRRIQVLHAETLEPAGPEILTSEFVADSCIGGQQKIVAATLQRDEPLTGLLAAWDIATGKPQFEPITLPGAASTIASRGESSAEVAILCASGDLLVYDVSQGRKLRERKLTEAAEIDGRWRLEYTPDGNSLVVLTADDLIHVLSADSLEPRFEPIAPVVEGGPCRSFAISADGQQLATAVNGKNFARVWSLADGQPLSPPLPHPGDYYGLFSVAFSPDGTRLLTGSKDGQARYWDWAKGSLAGPALTHQDEIWSVAITPDGQRALIALRGRMQSLHLWDLATGKPLAPPLRLASASDEQLHAHTIVVSRDGSRAYSGNYGELRLIDLAALLAPPERTPGEFKMLGQLAAGRLIEQGDMRPLSKEEWLERWEEFRAAMKDHQ